MKGSLTDEQIHDLAMCELQRRFVNSKACAGITLGIGRYGSGWTYTLYTPDEWVAYCRQQNETKLRIAAKQKADEELARQQAADVEQEAALAAEDDSLGKTPFQPTTTPY